MNSHIVTVEVPERLFDQLQQRAADSRRSVQQELLDVLATQLTNDEQGAARIQHALAGMERYSDADLWTTASAHLSSASCQRSQELNDKQRSEGLTPAERVELESLVTQYEWNMLIRAKSLALLKQRGHDISPLLVPPGGAA
jgi:plasmid stability protein